MHFTNPRQLNVEKVAKAHWKCLVFTREKAQTWGQKPTQMIGQWPLMGPGPLRERRMFLSLHRTRERTVSCTWEPGASAPFFIQIYSPAIEVLLLLGVFVFYFWFWICSINILKNENMFFFSSVKTCQCTKSYSCWYRSISTHR